MTTPDAADRRKARLLLKETVVVEAGAGTGKTTLLADRILFALLAGGPKGEGSDVTRVVALTFTEKAAGEIKERLHQRLLDLLARLEGKDLPANRRAVADEWLADARSEFRAGPDEVRAMAHAALSRLDRSMIHTIHGFAAHLLRRHPLAAGVDPGFVVDAGEAFDESFSAEWARYLDAELGLTPRRRKEWVAVLRLAGLDELEALSRDLADEAAALAPRGALSARPRVEELLRSVRGIIAAEKPKPKGNSKIGERLPELEGRLAALLAAFDAPPALDPEPRHAPYRPSAWPKGWDGVPGREDYEAACALAEACDAQGHALVEAARSLAAEPARRVREELRRRGRVGFDGLLSRARDLVKTSLPAREFLKGQFDAILVDEFQDTDPLQGELLLFLAERPGGGAGRWEDAVPQPGKLFVVGDPKQSIYRFRGADIRAFESFTSHLKAHGAVACDLTTNFRSHAGLVAPVNAVFKDILRYERWLQPEYKPLSPAPGRDAPGGPAADLVLVCHPEDAEGTVDNLEAAVAQARWAAGWIGRECGPGRRPLRDVALLFRTAGHMRPFASELKAAGIRFAVEAENAFFAAPEVTDFLNLLRVLSDPEDKVSLAGLLRSPMCALEDRDLLALAEADGLDPRRASTNPRVEALFRQLRSLSEHAGREPLGRFAARVLQETFLLENAAAAYHGEQAPANLLKLARLAAEAGESDGLTLREFALRAAELAADDREGESPLADEGVDAVRLLTMHKSKGLEFPVVFLPELHRGSSTSAPDGALYDWGTGSLGLRVGGAKSAAWHFNDALRRRREERERVRLLYVAMTRAKERLVLMGSAAPKQHRGDAFCALLRQAGAWPEKAQHPDEALFPIEWLPAGSLGPCAAERAEPAPLDAGALAAAWKGRLAEHASLDGKPVFSAPSSADGEWDGRVEEADPAPRETARLVGTLCHKVLERWDYRKGGDLDGLLAACLKALRGADAAADWDAVAAAAKDILGGFVRSEAAGFLAGVEILGREVPFVRRLPDGTIERGAMDLLYRKDGRLWVADYKTAGLKDAGKKWGAQGKAYCEAVGGGAGFAVVGLRAGRVLAVDLP